MLISIITPSYNQGQFLEQTIQSVLAQDYPHIEYLIIDGGSKDNSIEIIQRYAKRLAYWESSSDRGQAHAINKGLQRASGEVLGWLNSDDLLLPDAVSRVVAAFRDHPDVDVVYGRIERIDERGEIVPTPLLPKDKVVFSKQLVVGECVINQPGAFWQRSIMEKAGMLDEDLHYAMDYEYWIRLALAGAQFMRLPETLAQFRLSGSSKTVGQLVYMSLEDLSVIDRLLSRPSLPQELGMSPDQLKLKARKLRGSINLKIFYGYFKRHQWQPAFTWLTRALRSDPLALFQWRWISLGAASILRRMGHVVR